MASDSEPADAPAPWALRASGYILVLRLPREQLEADGFMPDALRGTRRGPFAYAMFVDYAQTPVGPYQELLFIPGAFRYGERSCFTITKIYVSSVASIVNGRRNWGIPKELAQFTVDYGGDRRDRICMRVDGREAVELVLKHYPVGFPLLGALVPAGMRTLCQTLDGRRFTFAPTVSGAVRAGKVLEARVDGGVFPAFGVGDVVAAVRLPEVVMGFPVAGVEEV